MKPTTELLRERAKTHGDFKQNAEISQSLKLFFRKMKGYKKLNMVQQEALDMIFLKLSRIMSGQPNVQDHWDDIGGYAELASRQIFKDNVVVTEKKK